MLTGLDPFTTYFYRAYAREENGANRKTGEIHSFTTDAAGSYAAGGSLELPGSDGNADKVVTVYKASNSSAVNYTFNYSYSRYASLWTAYSLTQADVLDEQIRASWSYYPAIENQYQVAVGGNNGYPSNYINESVILSENNYFARGHQIPDADRKNASDKAQTYYLTNQTPQIQNGFNSGIWSNLETAGRQFVVTDQSNSNYYNASFSTTDVLYIVTGPCYQKKNGNETVHVLTANSSSTVPSQVPIPNYYWKAFLKVRKDGSGNVVSAKAIGFWFEHREYSGDSYTNHVVSVDQIETWTGFDLFANLPDNLEDGTNGAEKNASWIAFRDF